MSQRILVWDIPTRVFHWALALSFAIAFLTAETERYRDLHVALGYLTLGLVAFRLAWGFAGTRYARFSSYTFRPAETLEYVKSLIQRNPRHYLGHNPAGAIAIFLLLGLTLLTGLSGALLYFDVGDGVFEDLHEAAANSMLAVVLIHIAGVIISSLMHRENLARSMITGYKSGDHTLSISRPYAWLGVIMVVLMVAFLTWFQPADSGGPGDGSTASTQYED